ncbi:nuclear valosin-containing protein-like protein [Carex littledalei]|uniref:Nuclear valosin-containing protein-like protein n=1 Tax=Carex littledalei TaxID=544730 RepID=A0A833VDE1_9POAL|nr:nuclear valosin-containing protein-like protein [Carex littledalei]
MAMALPNVTILSPLVFIIVMMAMAPPNLTFLSPLVSFIVILSLLRIICSHRFVLHCISWCWQLAGKHLQAYQHFTVPRYRPDSHENSLYYKVATYISSLPILEKSDSASFFSCACSSNTNNTNEFNLHLGPGDTVHDSFDGAHITWTNKQSDGNDCFVLCIKRQDRVRVLQPYLLHVEYQAGKIEQNRHELRLFTHTSNKNGEHRWISMPFTHPATFDTLVFNHGLKKQVCVDLENFMRSRSFYHRLGRVWNRSYLLYGQPGTGKSSFAVAMARALCFDVCIIDISHCSIDILETLLLRTRPRSLILLKNLDFYLNKSTTESGNANINSITNRVISCCGDERIMVFTMTGGEDLVDCTVNPTGRFDMHVYLPMCDFNTFMKLADRYLGVREHNQFQVIEEGFERGLQISPARVGEIMLSNRQCTTRTVQLILQAMESTVASKAGSNSRESGSQPKTVRKSVDDKSAVVSRGWQKWRYL